MNQTDHVLISTRFTSAITDITVLRGPDTQLDHNLLKINFKVKLRVINANKYNEKRKMVNIFQNPEWKQEYAIEINNSLKYWKILTLKIVLTIIFMKNGEILKQQSKKLNNSLQKRMKVQKHLKMSGTMRNTNLQKKK